MRSSMNNFLEPTAGLSGQMSCTVLSEVEQFLEGP